MSTEHKGAYVEYAPLNEPKPFGENVWIVDGPEIRMDLGPFKVPFPTRMTVVRLADGGLWLHSPIAPDEALFAAIEKLGEVRWLVAPNSIHYWFMADWIERYPEAQSLAVPDLDVKAKRPFRIDTKLEDGTRFPWSDEIDWLLVPGTSFSEAVFFVKAAQVLVLVDLIENFEPERVNNPLQRWALKLAGATGSLPIDARMTFRPKMDEVRVQVAKMLDWPVVRVTMAHGKPITEDVPAALERAFRWAS
ncbi:DUF4336 domain-containing protein [Aurantiacibacter xanthus]|uniref:DUF4336 domain-containing protein n=1 Tax=Aurantiacibacter xanthus TaxID=1784712 RepID=A0A3A1P9K3_9SPHN|nr:DUF4336 domain-containing protein [Aurantiacibacter xanthus]RIV88593.1 DUF4336 domain-containing protein [Aurantiacibacter xanthus]